MTKKAKEPAADVEVQTFDDVFDAIADTPAEAENMRARAALIDEISAIIESKGWSQAEAAQHAGVTQPRINDLLRGRLARFSLDALVNIASALGYHVRFELTTVRPAIAA